MTITYQFVKLPVVVEAARLEGSNAHTHAIYKWVESHVGSFDPDTTPAPTSGIALDPATGNFLIATLEGIMTASPGDWIIRGVAGEFYPCKNEIFEATYRSAPSSLPLDKTDRAISTVANALLANLPREFLWEDYPDIGVHDWDAVVKRADAIADGMAPPPAALDKALELLAHRASRGQELD